MHRSAGKSPGFISWPCHMTWGQGYQRLPPHMERISGHRLQQLLVSSPVSILYSAHACTLLKTQTRQPWSATAIEMMDELHVCPQPVTPAGLWPKAWTPFCTHLLSLEVFLFPAGGGISVCHIPMLQCFFKKKLFAPFQASPSAVICLHLYKMGCFFTGHCRVRSSMLVVLWNQRQGFCGKARKDFGCIIPCHEVPRYMRSAGSVTASWLVQRGTMAAMTGKVWNQKNRMGVTRDYRINKKDCFPQNVGYDGFAVASSRQTLVRQQCPTQDVGVGRWLSMKLCNKIYHRTLETEKHWL